MNAEAYRPSISGVSTARQRLKGVARHTALEKNLNLSDTYGGDILLKREDLQVVRSYKIRGAYNKIASLPAGERSNGVVCASAGNHAQGVAMACRLLNIQGTIFMPSPTPRQKISQVEWHGRENIDVQLVGDNFDECYDTAVAFSVKSDRPFIHPFNDPKTIEGQGTVALEILEDVHAPIDYVFVPVGGGGLTAGMLTVFKELSPDTKIIGVEPAGAPAMFNSLQQREIITLDTLDPFIDGACVKTVGDLTFDICSKHLDDMIVVPEGQVCTALIELYDKDAIVVEPAGALSIAALQHCAPRLAGKTTVCVVSGSNNDITRMEEIKERSLLHEGLKHYFIVRFPQRAGALKEFVSEILGPSDDITHFEYVKKHNRASGPAIVGIVLASQDDFTPLTDRMKDKGFFAEYINDRPDLFQYLI